MMNEIRKISIAIVRKRACLWNIKAIFALLNLSITRIMTNLSGSTEADRRKIRGLPSSQRPVRIIGLDPGLRHTGWGIIESSGNQMRHLADGVVSTSDELPVADRLAEIHYGLNDVFERWGPDEASLEETFMNNNAASALKLGQARGVVMLASSLAGIPLREYSNTMVKQAITGKGSSDKTQVALMVKRLLPSAMLERADASDALAIALCHANHRSTRIAMQSTR
jgi:crossover junction endodeoxyribonuclease RuvC